MNKTNLKDCMIVIAGVTAPGTQLPLMFIAKGTTEMCESSQIGDISHHLRYFFII